MKEPRWVTPDEAVAMNALVIGQFGGLDAGVRDENHLKAALTRPISKWHYDDPRPDLFGLAAAYGFAVARGHVFRDGNKRTAYVVATTFLVLNGIDCAPPQAEIVETMVTLAEGRLSEDELAAWFRRNAHPASS